MENDELEKAAAAGNISLGGGVSLNIKRMSVCGDLFDSAGEPLGSGNYEVTLAPEEIALLGISNVEPLSAKFLNGRAGS